jgi:hypothetical protein
MNNLYFSLGNHLSFIRAKNRSGVWAFTGWQNFDYVSNNELNPKDPQGSSFPPWISLVSSLLFFRLISLAASLV